MRKGTGKWLLCALLCAGFFLAVYFLAGNRGSAPETTPEPAFTPVPAPEETLPANALSTGRPGLYRIDGWLYALGPEGEDFRAGEGTVLTFDADGRYTTGDGQLDTCLAQALHASGADALEGDEALQAAYLYIKNEFHYKVKPEDAHTEENGSVDWINERALRFLMIDGGTCYGYAASFGLLARCLGYEAHIVAAEINQHHEAHAFVVIPEDGTDYIYDVEMEDTRPERHSDLDLYRQTNHQIYSYWYEPAW